MININWDEFKEYKKEVEHSDDNFDTLLTFLKSYYNMTHPVDIFDTLHNDDIAVLMLEKRDLRDAEEVENYMRKFKNG